MGWAIVITFCLLTISIFQFEIFRDRIVVFLNMTGVVAPVAVSLYLLLWRKVKVLPAALSTGVVAILTYPFVNVENGLIVIGFPYWLFPLAVAVGMSLLLVKGKDTMRIAALSYFSGSMGMFIGGDLLRALNLDTGSFDIIYFGANGLLDFVFLSGVICVGIVLFGSMASDWVLKYSARRVATKHWEQKSKDR
jgi:uncharacterized membrane protein